MPSGRSKEDTWTENDLKKAIQGDSKERKPKSKSRDRDKESSSQSKEKERSSHKDRERKSERQRDDVEKEKRRNKEREVSDEGPSRDRSEKRSKEDGSRDDRGNSRRDKDKDREREKDRKRERDNEKQKDKGDKESDRKDKERRHRDREDSGKEKHHKERKHRDEDEGERERKRDDEKEKRRDKESRKDRESLGDKERRKDRESSGDKERRKDRESSGGKEHRRDKESSRDKERKRDRESSGDKDRRKDKEPSGDKEKRRKQRDDFDDRVNHREREGSSKDRKKHRESSGNKDRKAKEVEPSAKVKEIEKEKARKAKEIETLRQTEEAEKKRKEEEAEKNAENEYDYEDDFDDYDDDDFEDDDGDENDKDGSSENESESDKNDIKQNGSGRAEAGGMMMPQHSFLQMSQSEKAGLEELMQAISKENETASTNLNSKSDLKINQKDANSNDENKKTHGKINFVAASKKQMSDKVSKKTKKRGEELLGLIQLDVRSIELFDMPPMTEYELYMKRFGSSDSRQMFTQTNDENFDQECQTDEIETETRWCQHTSDSKSAGTAKGSNDQKDDYTKDPFINSDSVRLNKFLLKASKVCLALLEEIAAGIEQPRKQYVETRSNLSEGYVSLGSSEFLVLGRDVCDITYSPAQTNMLLTAHGTSNVVMKDLKSSKGLMCVWNTNEPNKPTRLLVCESVPKSCCFGGASSSYAFAGMEDGVIAVWDLTEPAFYHDTTQIGNTMLVFQSVTFTTAALEIKHAFPVVAVTPLTSYTGSSQAEMSFQLASMDQSASVNVWTLVRTQTDNLSDLKNVTDDLGLAPHGRVKLVNSASITPPGVSISSFTHLFSMKCLRVDETNSSSMYAGTEHGDILHMTRFNSRPTPKFFRQGDGSNSVNSIDVCPWKMPYILACYDDGCVRLFHTKTEDALIVWANTTTGASLNYVEWSHSRPSVFFTMDSDSVLYIWNLLESDIAPIQQMKIQRKDKRAVGFTLANDYSALGKGSPGRAPEMALIFGDGSVEIHRLTKALCTMEADELDRMEAFLANIT